jgi:hypothetical protein
MKNSEIVDSDIVDLSLHGEELLLHLFEKSQIFYYNNLTFKCF